MPFLNDLLQKPFKYGATGIFASLYREKARRPMTVIIGKNVVIPENVHIEPFVVIGDDVRLGKNCVIGSFSKIGRGCILGRNVVLKPGCILACRTIIENNVLLGPHVVTLRDQTSGICGVEIAENSFIGANTVIMPGCRIGRDVVVGACSLVKKSIPDNGGTWAGTPARPLMRTKVLNNLLRESAMAKLTG